MLALFLGACEAVACLHHYRLPDVAAHRGHAATPSGASDATLAAHGLNDDDDDDTLHQDSARPIPPMVIPKAGDADAEDEAPLIESEEDAHMAYPPAPAAPGTTPSASDQNGGGAGGELMPYSHRDIKPGNIMIADDGTPLLYDFGSTIKARRMISDRRAAVAEQDLAAEQSTMPYRAPELFDVKTNTTITESVDIWSLGCVLYAMAYLHSPFETEQTVEQGGSLALAVLNGDYKMPAPEEDIYSERTRGLIRHCLTLDPAQRPDIDAIISQTRDALQAFQ